MGYTLVTGATSDIGQQICQTLVGENHKLLLTDLSEEMLEVVRYSLAGDAHLTLQLDLSDVEESRNKLAKYIEEKQIAIENVVFAAGIFALKPLKTLSYEFVKRSFDVSVFSVLFISQILSIKKLNNSNLKNIVMVSSISAVLGTKGYAAYGAMKASLLGIMKSLAAELAPIRVNAVLPGGIRTRTTNFLFEAQDEINPRYLLGEGKAVDVANVIAFLLSEKARWITGQEFFVDGGYSCN